MKILRFLMRIVLHSAAALSGNWIGGTFRAQLTSEDVQTIQFEHTTPGGTRFRNFPVVSKFYPALLFARLGKPGWLYTFLGGVVTGLLVDDRWEAWLWDQVGARFFDNKTSQQIPIPGEKE